MKKTSIYFIIIFSFFSYQITAQNKDLPKDPIAGKCYNRTFNLNERYEWKTVPCKEKKKQLTVTESIKKGRELSQKIKRYQEFLNAKGYNIKVSGNLNDKTISAHHSYLKVRKKEAKLERKKARKAERLKRKNNTL